MYFWAVLEDWGAGKSTVGRVIVLKSVRNT